MKAYFINLDSAAERRSSVVGMFSAAVANMWQLTRVTAVDAGEVRRRLVMGRIGDAEKACILSHRKAIEASLDDDEDALILEDDAHIGPRGFKALEGIGRLVAPDVDMIFSNCLIANSDLLLTQYLIYVAAMRSGKTSLFDMKSLLFAGTDAYALRKRAKVKLLKLFDATPSLDLPYDLLLKRWIQMDSLKAVVTFPFLSSLSKFSDQSLITTPNAHWNAFRRLFCVDASHFPEDRGEAVDRSALEGFTDDYLRLLRVFLLDYRPN